MFNRFILKLSVIFFPILPLTAEQLYEWDLNLDTNMWQQCYSLKTKDTSFESFHLKNEKPSVNSDLIIKIRFHNFNNKEVGILPFIKALHSQKNPIPKISEVASDGDTYLFFQTEKEFGKPIASWIKVIKKDNTLNILQYTVKHPFNQQYYDEKVEYLKDASLVPYENPISKIDGWRVIQDSDQSFTAYFPQEWKYYLLPKKTSDYNYHSFESKSGAEFIYLDFDPMATNQLLEDIKNSNLPLKESGHLDSSDKSSEKYYIYGPATTAHGKNSSYIYLTKKKRDDGSEATIFAEGSSLRIRSYLNTLKKFVENLELN